MTEQLQEAAPADTTPIEQPTEDQTQEPVTDEGQAEEKETPKPKRRTAREALEKAFAGGSETKPTEAEKAAAEAKAAEKAEPKKPEAKDEPKGPQRAPDGKFAAKEATEKPQEGKEAPKATEAKADHNAPPSRFSADAKGEWEKAPESIRAETHRAIREMEKGIKEKDQVLKPLEPYIKMAREHGTSIDKALENYIGIEKLLRENPHQGFQRLGENLGMTPIHTAATVLGVDAQALHQALQQANPQGQRGPDPRDQQIMQLQRQIQTMQQQFGQVSQTVQQQREQEAIRFVEQFAADKPRFDELSDEILRLIDTGYATDLEDAYTKAERLNPAPQPAPEPEPTTAPPAQTRPARSLTGAPSPGSNPTAKRTPAKNPRDALKKHLFG